MMKRRYAVHVVIIAIVLSMPAVALSVVLEGSIRDGEGNHIRGAIITLTAEDGLFSESIYSNDSGRFRIDTNQLGNLKLRVRKPDYADDVRPLNIASDDITHKEIVLRRLVSAQEISDNLTASAHFTRVKFEDQRSRRFFQADCLSCHQIGNAFTRAKRTTEQWTTIVTRMQGFLGVKDEQSISRYVTALSNAFDGTPVTIKQDHSMDPVALRARITEWKLPQGIIAHDTEVNDADGKFYTVDEGLDQIYITDPLTNKTEIAKFPANGIPVGGKFMQMFAEPNPLGLSVRHGPHSIQLGPDGRFYVTNAISGEIGIFDPLTRGFAGYPVGDNAMYPHTLRFDQQGRVWFTLAMSNQVGRFDPATKEMRVIDMPATSERPAGPTHFPYGIDVNPVDGSIWYSRLFANRIGRIDPVTLEVQEFNPPLVGPRRMRFSADGILWIPAFGDGSLVRLDPLSMQYKSYPMPTLSEHETEAPYALAVHPQTQEVWMTANMSDRVFRFLPDEERFITYALPTRGTYQREFFFPADGRICAPSSPMPALPTVVEGGMQALLCIDPGG